ncbi:SRPBCC family protein [Nocardia alba]|uniref:Polyketide cyclase/dehydrase/lipid transport protein n=1 Tax=Nocardia alba TaxID=225051 RepID=A0A4R1G4G3_9NOCA|nr:SRPBCC family protein [Nocardia alba]TCK00199.1 polyketide cyclase/dehydrase/lipid transport protein [Nocardia alba]
MGNFEVSRRTVIAADPARIHALIDNFGQWRLWSPWEDADPQLARTYTGPESGVGARYAWRGNRKAGAGVMEIKADAAREIGVELTFEKPFKATNFVTFTLTPVPGGTEVTWRMTGTHSGMMGVLGKVFPIDNLIGKDFDKGLAKLKTIAESTPA